MPTGELFDPYAALGVPSDASQELIEIAFKLIEKRFASGDRGRRNIISSDQYRQARRAREMLTDPDFNPASKQHSRFQQARQQFTMRVTTSRTQLPVIDEPQVLYARIDFEPLDVGVRTSERGSSNLNLTLVLDRSNSMAGTRLDKVKAAAFQIIDNMTAEDVLSVVAFSDRASIVIPATHVKDKASLKAQVTMMTAFGGTEIYHGLNEGIRQNREFLDPKYVNHVLLLTDGNTYGDEEQCKGLATNANIEGIGISAMGLGSDWNDEFLDALATATGGTSQYIRNVGEVGMFINNHVRHLASSFAERLRVILELAPGVDVEQMFKISPLPQPVEMENNEIRLGILEARRPTTLLLQFRITPGLEEGIFNVARIIGTGDILVNSQPMYYLLHDIVTEVTSLQFDDETNTQILEALSRLALYRMQEQANEALKRGEYEEATRRLEKLATRLLAMGQGALATHVLKEAHTVKTTHILSSEAKKTIKYNTRVLMSTKIIDEE